MSKSDAVSGSDDKTQRTGPVTFTKQSIAELRKVVWPTQEQLVTYFIVVMVFVVIMMTFVALLDLGFGRAVFEIFGNAGVE